MYFLHLEIKRFRMSSSSQSSIRRSNLKTTTCQEAAAPKVKPWAT